MTFLAAPAGTTRAAFLPLYSDTTNFSGFNYAPGSGTATVGGQLNTLLIADDITAGPGLAGLAVNQLTFSIFNGNSTSVSAGVDLRIFAGDGTGGGPGTVLAALDFHPITVGAGLTGLFTFTSTTSTIFTIPSGLFWAGLSFNDFVGTTGDTVDQLNGLGQGIFAPPTVGTSRDLFFQSTSATTGDGGNPAGSFLFFGGNPVADFGFGLATVAAAPVPGPPSLVLVGFGGLVLAGSRVVRSRRSAEEVAAA